MSKNINFDDTFLARWLAGELTPNELKSFEESEHFESYKKIADATSKFQPPSWSLEDNWANLQEKQNSKSPSRSRPKYIKWIGYATAACIVLLIGYTTIMKQDTKTLYRTEVAEKQNLSLPDGSMVYMNTNSTVSFEKERFNNDRKLFLEGEAFFEVKEGSTFSVQTSRGTVSVLGTSFNIKERGNRMVVKCYTGSVKVLSKKTNTTLVLTKGEATTVEGDVGMEKYNLKTQNEKPFWTAGKSVFENAPLVEVINELERQFDIQVNYTQINIKDIKYNGGFDHNNRELALEIVFTALGITYETDGKVVTLINQ